MTGYSSSLTTSPIVTMIYPGTRGNKSQDFVDALKCLHAALSNSAIFGNLGGDYLSAMLEREAWRAVDSGGGVLVVRASEDGSVATSFDPIRSVGLFLSGPASAKDDLLYLGTDPNYQGYGLARPIVHDAADCSEAAGHTLFISVKGDHEDYACQSEHEHLLKFYHSFGRFSHKSAARSASNADDFQTVGSGMDSNANKLCDCPPDWLVSPQ